MRTLESELPTTPTDRLLDINPCANRRPSPMPRPEGMVLGRPGRRTAHHDARPGARGDQPGRRRWATSRYGGCIPRRYRDPAGRS